MDPGELDLEAFGRLTDQGRLALAAGDAEGAAPEASALRDLIGSQASHAVARGFAT